VEKRLPALKCCIAMRFVRSSKRLFREIPFACLISFRGSAYWSLLAVDTPCLGVASASAKEAL
jgi:hypothetical protein